jgi:hypothetical protein
VWSSGASEGWGGTAINLFDGDEVSVAYSKTGSNLCTIPMNIMVNTSVRVKGYWDKFYLTIAGVEYITPFPTISGPNWITINQTGLLSQIKNIDGVGGISAIEVDGRLLVDTGIPGGPETQVTGSAMSGTGNFDGNAGVVVDVANSNQQWISNDNRLGEEFFIKSASTRTGLAILRAEAIKIAAAYDPAKAPYPVRSLVIYEGDYYVSAGLVGPGQDRWIDLGRTVNN